MSGFDSEWLALREPADQRARAAGLVPALARLASPLHCLRIVDLGCGTGSGLRWLSPRLAGAQRWLGLDDDPALLSAFARQVAVWAAARGATPQRHEQTLRWQSAAGAERLVTTRRIDLARMDLPVAIAGAHLVTASALADLVSRDWLARLASACARQRAALLLSLNYDGRIRLCPARDGDQCLRKLFNDHQYRDKGFGPALGPSATAVAASLLAEHGCTVQAAPSDWSLQVPREAALIRALLAGWMHAAVEMQPGRSAQLQAWHRQRLTDLADEQLSVTVGHQDLLALPA